MTAISAAAPATSTRVALPRLLRAELRWVFGRPRTLAVLGLFAVIPMIVGLAVTLTGGPPSGEGDGNPAGSLLRAVAGNPLVLAVATLIMTLTLLLPLAAAMAGADALAGETAHGTLRGWLLAPVSRGRLLTVKAVGVASVALAAVLILTVVAVITGMVLGGVGSLTTLSGTTLSFGAGLGRVAVAAGWVAGQLLAVGAVALAVSAFTEHPMVVVAAILAGDIVFTVLGSLSALSWLHPFLLTTGWQETVVDVLRDPIPTAALAEGTLRAACYIVIGLSLAYAKLTSKDG